ncbi:mitotic spindle assembly checkpoint protein MAD1-like [Macrosteles quadrilineatus]|uniref:mitotic spindle assembly checkpoint protein MAD1-like n=1 Tax=Macrosteles quadrilineatus TaxID=74068 RepID=UPI0023E226C5|nr:mitotic spindle assembly checkpoint protein MAD1-like [Macrosteles quadrilineatus]
MDRSDDKDPTCVIKLLDDFRSSSANKRTLFGAKQSFPFGFPPPSMTKRTKLNFDDSLSHSQNESGPSKKLKLGDESADSSIDSSKVSESSVMASPWEARRLKAELAEARAQIASLEARFNKVYALRRETELVFEQEKNELQRQIEWDRNKIQELEQRLKTVRKREAEARDELDKFRNSQKQDKYNLDDRCEKLQLDNAQLKDKLTELEATSREKCEAVERQLASVEVEAANVKAELVDAKKLVEELTCDLRERRRELRQLETNKTKLLVAQQRIKELEYEREIHMEAYNLAQNQQTKLLRVTELEKELASLKEENKNLRQATSNTVYLEGLVEDLRSRVAQTEERERECVSLRVELGVVTTRLAEWSELHRVVIGHSPGPGQGPLALRRYIETLQQRELALSQEKATAERESKSIKEAHNEKLKELQEANTQLSTLKKNLELQSTKVRRLRKQITLITWERDDLRNLVDSCQKEVTMTSASLESLPNARLEALERLVSGYQQRMEQLEADPSLAVVDPEGISNKAAAERLDKLVAENAALTKEKDALMKEVEELKIQMEYRSLKGDFDMRDCKILHFKMNPVAEAEQKQMSELEIAHAELARLRERLRLMEEGQTHDLTSVVNDRMASTSTKEMEELKEKIKSFERQNQRLREVFKTTSHEFREAVYQLFGYKVDGLANKIYRLSNLYAEAPDDHLLFKMSSGGMELLETPFSSSCGEMIDLHLHHHHSIPMFLSALTMDLFQRQTMTVH